MHTRNLAEIVGCNPNLDSVLEEWGLDFARFPDRDLASACSLGGVEFQEVLAALTRAPDSRLTDLAPNELVSYVREHHHDYLREQLPALLDLLQRSMRFYGASRPELRHIAQVFHCLVSDLRDHLDKEELFAFPWVGSGTRPDEWVLESLANDRHRTTFRLSCLRFLTNNYTVPEQTGESYRQLYAGLRRLEKNLRQHVFVEDQLLFRQAA